MKFLVQLSIDAEVSVEAESIEDAKDVAADVVHGLHELMVEQVSIITVDADGDE